MGSAIFLDDGIAFLFIRNPEALLSGGTAATRAIGMGAGLFPICTALERWSVDLVSETGLS